MAEVRGHGSHCRRCLTLLRQRQNGVALAQRINVLIKNKKIHFGLEWRPESSF